MLPAVIVEVFSQGVLPAAIVGVSSRRAVLILPRVFSVFLRFNNLFRILKKWHPKCAKKLKTREQ